MKKVNFLASFILVLALGYSSTALGQYDDLYYDPDRDSDVFSTRNEKPRPASEPVASRYGDTDGDYADNQSYGSNYDEDEYDYYDDYDYHYSSRIRRFHRPYYGFNYYDPVYVDAYYYDPFINPGMTVLIYDGFGSWNSWRSWRRWNRWNSWGSFNRGWGWNSWNDPWNGGWNSWGGGGWNNWGGGGWNNWGGGGWNNWGGNGWNNWGGGWNNWGGNGYCPPSWGNGYDYNTVNTGNNNTYYGPRNTGSTKVPRKNDRSPGITKPETGPLVPNDGRQTTAPGGVTQPGVARDRNTERTPAEDGKTRTDDRSNDAVGTPRAPRRDTEYENRNPVNERPTRSEPTPPSRPRTDESLTPRREEPAPSRSRIEEPRREEAAPSRPSRVEEPRAPRREEAAPSRPRRDESAAPTRKDDTPAREYRERSNSNSGQSRSYEAPRNSSPSRSYDSGGSSRSSSPSPRSNDNGGKSRSGGRNGG